MVYLKDPGVGKAVLQTALSINFIKCIGFQKIYSFKRNKKVKAQPRPFYSYEMSKLSEILYNL